MWGTTNRTRTVWPGVALATVAALAFVLGGCAHEHPDYAKADHEHSEYMTVGTATIPTTKDDETNSKRFDRITLFSMVDPSSVQSIQVTVTEHGEPPTLWWRNEPPTHLGPQTVNPPDQAGFSLPAPEIGRCSVLLFRRNKVPEEAAPGVEEVVCTIKVDVGNGEIKELVCTVKAPTPPPTTPPTPAPVLHNATFWLADGPVGTPGGDGHQMDLQLSGEGLLDTMEIVPHEKN